MTSSKLVSSLARFSTCEVADAMLKLKKQTYGGFVPGLEILSPAPGKNEDTSICGPVYTVKMVRSEQTDAPKLTSGHFVDLAPADSVMVISSPPDVISASLGGLLGIAAKGRGVKGVIVDGRCRDLAELRNAGLPVFARGHSILGQSPFTRPSEVGVSLSLPQTADSQLSVQPTDLVLADIDGVVFVALEDVEEVVAAAEKGREVDGRCKVDIEAGKGVKETFAKHRGK